MGNSHAIWDHSVTCHPTEVRILPLPPAVAGSRLRDPEGLQCRVDLCYMKADWLGIEHATCRSQERRPTTEPPRNTVTACLFVCLFFVPYARPQIRVDLHEIWHVASSYPTDGHEGLVSTTRAHGVALHTPGNLELAGGRDKGSSTIDT